MLFTLLPTHLLITILKFFSILSPSSAILVLLPRVISFYPTSTGLLSLPAVLPLNCYAISSSVTVSANLSTFALTLKATLWTKCSLILLTLYRRYHSLFTNPSLRSLSSFDLSTICALLKASIKPYQRVSYNFRKTDFNGLVCYCLGLDYTNICFSQLRLNLFGHPSKPF